MTRNRRITAAQITAGDVPETDDELATLLESETSERQAATQRQAEEEMRDILEQAASYEAPTADVFSFGDAPTSVRPARDGKHPCLCGCGELCGARRFFAMGHDARTKSLIANGAMTPDQIPAHIRSLLLAGSDSWQPFFSGEARRVVIAREATKAASAAERMLVAEQARQDRATKANARKAARAAADAALPRATSSTPKAATPKLTAAERMTAKERESLLVAMADMRDQGLLAEDDDDEAALLAAQEAAEEAANDETEDVLVS